MMTRSACRCLDDKAKNMSEPAEPQKPQKFDLLGLENLYDFVEFLKNKRGNDRAWVQTCRWGLRGMESRLLGIQYNSSELMKCDTDDYFLLDSFLSSIFFHMDSAFECLVFAINAIGNPLDSEKFYKVNSASELRKVNPSNVITSNRAYEGYSHVFPKFQKYCLIKKEFINKLNDYHDVSKHRRMLDFGAMSKTIDEPDGGTKKQLEFIQLSPNPRAPHSERNFVGECYRPAYLDELLDEFKHFMRESVEVIFEDTQKLKTRLETADTANHRMVEPGEAT
jgi:hypothetical protein